MIHGTCKHWQSTAILNSNILHGTVHHRTKFQADRCNTWRVRAGKSFGTDRQTDGRTDRWKDERLEGRTQWPTTMPVGLMAAEGKNGNFGISCIYTIFMYDDNFGEWDICITYIVCFVINNEIKMFNQCITLCFYRETDTLISQYCKTHGIIMNFQSTKTCSSC